MGVERCDYVMIAAKFDCKEFSNAVSPGDSDALLDIMEPYDDNSYAEDITSHNGLTMIYDGMCGRYVFFGEIVDKARYDEGFEPFNVDDLAFEGKREIIAEAIQKEAEALGIQLPPFKVGVYIFTHWH